MTTRPAHRLCYPCWEVLEPNIGRRCARCDAPVESRREVAACSRCAARPASFEAIRAPLIYGGGLAQLIKRAKFNGREDLAAALAHLIAADAVAAEWAQGATLVPVPLSRRRRWQRGYNQSAIVAQRLGRLWRRPVAHALQRTRHTATQSELTLAERRINVRQAFAPGARLAGDVLLIDDVVTSAETVHAAAQAVLAAGARRVRVVAVARASGGNAADKRPS